MLVELEIENLALIRHARVSLSPGLNALTGETGAGKTLVLRALGLLRGDRADRAQIGEEGCRVSGLIRVPDGLAEEIEDALAPAELDDGELVVTRAIGPDGRSRCHANGRLVPLATLRAVAGRLIDVLGQGEARELELEAHRAALIDAFGNLYRPHALYLAARERALARRARRDRLVQEAQERRQRLEFLRYQCQEIEGVAPEPGEADRLGRELEVLEAATELRALCDSAIGELYEGEDSINDRLARLVRRGEELSASDGARALLGPAGEALTRATCEIDEATASFRDALSNLTIDDAQRERISQRLDSLRRLIDRFGPTEAELFTQRAAAETEIRALEEDEQDTETADAALATAIKELGATSARLDKGRAAAGKQLAGAVQRELRKLGMAKAEFSIELRPNPGEDAIARAQTSGASAVDFLLAANPGHPAHPLAQVASGGESARIALALRVALSGVLDVPVMVFDEIESGVGARLGEVVGKSLRAVASRRQVLVVTHLPQVAAFADRHIRVTKRTARGATDSLIEEVAGAEREAEIAAMMRGKNVGRSTRSEARALLDQAEASS